LRFNQTGYPESSAWVVWSLRIHQTLRITPAMAAGITERVWNIEQILKVASEKR